MWNESSAKPCTRILFLQILLGVLLLGGVFLLAVNEDIAATQRTMVNTVNGGNPAYSCNNRQLYQGAV